VNYIVQNLNASQRWASTEGYSLGLLAAAILCGLLTLLTAVLNTRGGIIACAAIFAFTFAAMCLADKFAELPAEVFETED